MSLTLDPINSGYSQVRINENFQAIEDEINNRVLRRDKEVAEPNEMQIDLDLNDNNVLNVNSLDTNALTLNGVPVTTASDGVVEVPSAEFVPNVPSGDIASTNVQDAINELDTEKAATSHTHVEADITDLDKYTQAQVNLGFVDQDSDTGAANLPTGTTLQRPSSPAEGMFRRNSETGEFEGYNGSTWEALGGSSIDLENLIVDLQPSVDGGQDVGSASKGFDALYADSLIGRTSGDTLDINQLSTQIASAWVNFNGSGVVVIRDSFNISSITDLGTGQYLINFTSNLANANFCVVLGATDSGNSQSTISLYNAALPTVSGFTVRSRDNGSNLFDPVMINCAVFGGV